jgi:hypothetical protein
VAHASTFLTITEGHALLTIRDAQLAAFRDSALVRFERDMLDHLKSFAPWHANLRDDAYLRDAVRYGRERASRHGFSLRGPIQFFIELSCLLGAAFDTDPQYAWATRILEDKNEDELFRADRLHAGTMTYLDKVAGPENEHSKAALRRMKSIGVDLVTPGDITFEISALDGMRYLYPEKCEFIGQPALEALIEEGTLFATTHGAVKPADRGLCVGMMFVLGHGFASDPLLRWAREPLAEQRISAPERFMALRVGLRNYLDAILRSTVNT